jgi:hypothetical protein
MAQTVKIVTLVSQQLLISEIEEVAAVVPGEPDCKLINPFIIKDELVLEPWLLNVTKDDMFLMSSDKILTLVDPTPTLLEKYQDLTK